MTTEHLTDAILQQYALDPGACAPSVAVHVRTCAACRRKVEVYQVLMTGLGQQVPPAFDFSVADLVLPQLPAPAQRDSGMVLYALLLLVGLCGAGGVLYGIGWPFGRLFRPVDPLLLALVVTGMLTTLVGVVADMYIAYRKKLLQFS